MYWVTRRVVGGCIEGIWASDWCYNFHVVFLFATPVRPVAVGFEFLCGRWKIVSISFVDIIRHQRREMRSVVNDIIDNDADDPQTRSYPILTSPSHHSSILALWLVGPSPRFFVPPSHEHKAFGFEDFRTACYISYKNRSEAVRIVKRWISQIYRVVGVVAMRVSNSFFLCLGYSRAWVDSIASSSFVLRHQWNKSWTCLCPSITTYWNPLRPPPPNPTTVNSIFCRVGQIILVFACPTFWHFACAYNAYNGTKGGTKSSSNGLVISPALIMPSESL